MQSFACNFETKRAPSVLKYCSFYRNFSFGKKGTFHHEKGHFWVFGGGGRTPGSYAPGVTLGFKHKLKVVEKLKH